MPLGVLSVDIDKLLKNEVKTWSSEVGGLSPLRTPQRISAEPQPPLPSSSSLTSARKTDAFLIRGYDESRPWNGAVIRSAPTRPPSEGISDERPKGVTRSSAAASRRREPQRMLRDSSQRNAHGGSDSATASATTVSPPLQDDVLVVDDEIPDTCPVVVKLSWVPHQSYRHCTVSVSRRELVHASDGDSYGVPSEMPSLPHTPGTVRVASRGGSGAGAGAASAAPSPRLGSAGRIGSARRVRLVGIDDGTERTELGTEKDAHDPRRAQTLQQRTAATGRVGVPPRAPAAPLPPNTSSGSSSELKESNVGDSSVDDRGVPLSATAAEIIANSVEYVKTAIQGLVDRTAANSRNVQHSAEGADDAGTKKRLLSPRRPSTVDTFGNVTNGEHTHRRTSRTDMISRELRNSPRRASVRQEHEHQQAVREFRRLSVGNTFHPSLPSTLTTFQPSLLGKADAIFPAVFQLEYVRPPRTRVPFSQTARQRRLDADGLTTDERRTYDLILATSSR